MVRRVPARWVGGCLWLPLSRPSARLLCGMDSPSRVLRDGGETEAWRPVQDGHLWLPEPRMALPSPCPHVVGLCPLSRCEWAAHSEHPLLEWGGDP